MKKNLLDKYYKGETTLEEENVIKKRVLAGEIQSAEKDIFGYFQTIAEIPGDLEETLFANLVEKVHRNKTFKMRLFSISSAAAVILVILSGYLNLKEIKTKKMEDDFFVMEQALFQVSKSIQPEEQEEMLVLWVDENVEIIIN